LKIAQLIIDIKIKARVHDSNLSQTKLCRVYCTWLV